MKNSQNTFYQSTLDQSTNIQSCALSSLRRFNSKQTFYLQRPKLLAEQTSTYESDECNCNKSTVSSLEQSITCNNLDEIPMKSSLIKQLEVYSNMVHKLSCKTDKSLSSCSFLQQYKQVLLGINNDLQRPTGWRDGVRRQSISKFRKSGFLKKVIKRSTHGHFQLSVGAFVR